MEEKRRANRFPVSYDVRVFVDGINDVIGRIVDFSATGMRIISDKFLVTGCDYLVYVDLEEIEGFGEDVAFNSRCVWSREDESSGGYSNGMHLQDVGEKEQDIIDRLIESLTKQG